VPVRSDLRPPVEGDKGATARGSRARNPALARRASAIALGLALVLIGAKVWGWLLTGSLAMLTSAADGLVDALASLATFAGIRYALRPADLDHRFGHGKGEALAAFTQAILLGATGVVFGAQAGWRLLFPEPLVGIELGLAIAAGSLVGSGLLVTMQTWVLRRTRSTAIAADRQHYLTDVVVNLGVLAALAVTWSTDWVRADPAFALAIAVFMLWNAGSIAREASVQLLDRELVPGKRKLIAAAALGCPGARAIHDIRTRDAGDRVFVEFHLEVDGDIPVHDGHRIVDAAELAVAELFPGGVEVIGHLEPVGIIDERLDKRVRHPTRRFGDPRKNR
jgi:ferrous-iron efflux pump FieF